MTAPLVGLVGKKRAGKDTFAERLVENHGYRRVAFADPLRGVLAEVNPIIDTFEAWRLGDAVAESGWEAAKRGSEVRRLMQALGVAVRDLDPEFWLRIGMGQAAKTCDAGQPVVITDVRFRNEARAVLEAGGKLVRVERPGPSDGDGHVSEVELDTYPVDFLVSNDGTVEQFWNKADAIAARV